MTFLHRSNGFAHFVLQNCICWHWYGTYTIILFWKKIIESWYIAIFVSSTKLSILVEDLLKLSTIWMKYRQNYRHQKWQENCWKFIVIKKITYRTPLVPGGETVLQHCGKGKTYDIPVPHPSAHPVGTQNCLMESSSTWPFAKVATRKNMVHVSAILTIELLLKVDCFGEGFYTECFRILLLLAEVQIVKTFYHINLRWQIMIAFHKAVWI